MHTHRSDRDVARIMGRECFAFRVQRAARVVTRAYDHALAAAGVSAVQLTLLAAVANRPDLKMAELAAVVGMEPSSLSRAVAALAKKKLVRRVPTADARERFFELTPRGFERLRAAFEPWLAAQHGLKNAVGDVDAFTAVLDRVAAHG